MASTKHTTRNLKSQPKAKQSNQEWHEDRYGEHRDHLTDEHLKQIVEDICGKNYDETAAAALVLLMDEIERSQFDTCGLQHVATVVSASAFRYTEKHSQAAESLVATMRRDLARKDLVN